MPCWGTGSPQRRPARAGGGGHGHHSYSRRTARPRWRAPIHKSTGGCCRLPHYALHRPSHPHPFCQPGPSSLSRSLAPLLFHDSSFTATITHTLPALGHRALGYTHHLLTCSPAAHSSAVPYICLPACLPARLAGRRSLPPPLPCRRLECPVLCRPPTTGRKPLVNCAPQHLIVATGQRRQRKGWRVGAPAPLAVESVTVLAHVLGWAPARPCGWDGCECMDAYPHTAGTGQLLLTAACRHCLGTVRALVELLEKLVEAEAGRVARAVQRW